MMRGIIRRVLFLSGIDIGDVLEAENGEEALEILDNHWIDVILADINMPVMNGYEMLRRIKISPELRDIPVVVVSAEGRDECIGEILRAGAAGYVVKPFRPEDLAKAIHRALGVNPDERYVEEPKDSDF